MKKYDLIIIGAGTVGFDGLREAVALGKKVLLVEKEKLGGTCVNWGCLPKKALVRSMNVWKSVKRSSEFGITLQQAELNWGDVIGRKNSIIEGFLVGRPAYLEKMGVDYVMGEARFISSTKLQVGDTIYEAERYLIGTGSEPILPEIEGIEHGITSKEMLFLKRLPKSVVILGGGVIGMEMAHILANAGSKVTILHRSDKLLNSEDKEISAEIKEISEKMGIDIRLQATTQKITLDPEDNRVVHAIDPTGTFTVKADTVLVAVGRRPAIQGLDLEKASVDYTEKGVTINEYLQTTNQRVYAAGDAIGGRMFTPIAAHEAKTAVRNAFMGNHLKPDYVNMSRATFTTPPIGSVGLTEEQANEKGYDYAVGKLSLSHSGVAKLIGETEGFMKIMVDRKTQTLIGAHFIGAEADELIHLVTVAMKGKLTVQDFAEIIPVHPTLAESLIETIRGIK